VLVAAQAVRSTKRRVAHLYYPRFARSTLLRPRRMG
jgi:hypothetical protein